MADIHTAQLTPGKLDVITDWVRRQDWAAELDFDASPLEKVSAYRFDDPDGQVGLEVHIVRTGGRVFQVPLTYRGAPLAGADEHLVGTMEHSVLGKRWVYAAMGDPVFRKCLDDTIAEAGISAKQYQVDQSGARLDEITDVAHAFGTGPLPGAEDVQMLVELTLDSPIEASEAGLLLGKWPGQDSLVVLAVMV